MPSTEKAPAAQGKMTYDDFDQLGALLAADWAPESTLDVEQLDGFLAGLICAPRMVLPSAFVPEIFGGESPEFPDTATAERFFGLLMRRHNEIADALNAPIERLDDPRAYDPLLVDWDANVEDLQQLAASGELPRLPLYGELWARGFLRAVELTREDWDASRPESEEDEQFVDDALGAILALVPDDDEDEPQAGGAAEPADERDELVAAAIIAAYDLRDYWRDVQFEEIRVKEPIRRDAKVGRNDPCPCGSGKKFKQCHGREQ